MILLGLTAAAVAAAGLYYWSNQEGETQRNRQYLQELIQEYKCEINEENKYQIERTADGGLTVWRNAWVLPSWQQNFKISFTVNECVSGGLLVGLARKWKDASAGGVGLVIDDGCPTGRPNVDTSTYFCELPFWNKPSHHSAVVHNHVIRPKQEYWLEWHASVQKLTFGTPSSIFLSLPVDLEEKRFCYLSFGCVPCCKEEIVTISNVQIN